LNAKIFIAGLTTGLVLLAYYGLSVDQSPEAEPMSPARRVHAGLPLRLDVQFRDQPIVIDGTPGLESLVDDATLRVALRSALPNWRPPPFQI